MTICSQSVQQPLVYPITHMAFNDEKYFDILEIRNVTDRWTKQPMDETLCQLLTLGR